MRKIISVIFLLFMIFALSACNDIGSDEKHKDEASISDVANTDEAGVSKSKIKVSNMITVEGFLEELSKIIDLESYTDPSINENETFCILYDFHAYTKVDFDYKIALGNAEVIQLPKNYNELINEGWAITGELVDCELYRYAEPSTGIGAVLEKDGKRIAVMVMNNSDKIMQLKDCEIKQVEIRTTNNYKYKTIENIGAGFGFTICDNINHNSTIEEIFEKYGAPQQISISENIVDGKHTYSTMEVEYRPENQGGVLTFEFLVDKNKLMSVEYIKR